MSAHAACWLNLHSCIGHNSIMLQAVLQLLHAWQRWLGATFHTQHRGIRQAMVRVNHEQPQGHELLLSCLTAPDA